MNNKDLLNLIDITVSFEGFLALNKLNLNLKKGELRAVIGPNGAGKTTFLDVITGKVKPTKGEVIFKGKSLVGRKEHKIARLGVGRKFQSPRIFENLTVKENLEISVTTPKSPLNLINKSIKDEQLNEIDRLMKIVNLARQNQIDIAIDLKGYINNNRFSIFENRCAPIQINYLGYPGTLGANCIDYLIADKTVIPTENQKFYSEKIIYLPNTYLVNDSKTKISDKNFTREELGLPKNDFVFCCFNY